MAFGLSSLFIALNIPNPLLFPLKSTRKFPPKTYRFGKKRIALSQRWEGNTPFFQISLQPISMRHDLKTSSAI